MIICRLAYRHANGELEGFAGCGSTPQAACAHAERKIASKLACCRLAFDRARIVRSANGLSKEEMATLRADWKISERSLVL
jgi:hypothetical protein